MSEAAVIDHATVRAWVDERRDEVVKLLCDMIAIDSVTGSEGPMAEFCAGWLRDHGIESMLQPAKDRYNTIGVVGEGDRTLIISGHLDTVPPNEGDWTYGPWTPTVADGKVFGLGASDLHASQVGAYFAQLFFLQQGIALPGRYMTAYTIEEETTGDGTILFLDQAGKDGLLDFTQTEAVVTEPTDLKLCLGNRGSSFVVVTVKGLGGHGSRPHMAHNPVPKLMSILNGFAALEADWKERYTDPEFGFTTLTPTCFTAGDLDRTNVIPELARAVVDCRPTPEVYADDLAIFRGGVAAMIDGFREDGFEIVWEELYPREGQKLGGDHALARTVSRVLTEDLGCADDGLHYTPAGNDAVFMALKGIPTINKVGPGHVKCAHRVNEHITLENLFKGVELYIWIGLRHFGLV